MGEKAGRQSNIELLRIIAAMGVVLLHYNNPRIGGGFKYVAGDSVNQFVMILLEAVFICAVNVYVIISGYFMKGTFKRDLLKPVKLLSMLVVFELLAYLIKELPKGEGFSLAVLFGYFTPSYWFVFVFIALNILSPYINLMWSHLSRQGQKRLLTILILLFSVWPIIWEIASYISGTGIWGEELICSYGLMQGLSSVGLFGSEAGYTIVNFVLVYLIGCYLKDIEEDGVKFKNGTLILLLLLNLALIIGWTYGEYFLTGQAINATTGWNYESPFVISEAVLVFLLFKNMKIKNSKVINLLAGAAFPTYLIHINLLEYLKIEHFVQESTLIMVLHIFGSLIGIYFVCFAVFMLYDLVTKPVFKMISGKWQEKRYIEIKP